MQFEKVGETRFVSLTICKVYDILNIALLLPYMVFLVVEQKSGLVCIRFNNPCPLPLWMGSIINER